MSLYSNFFYGAGYFDKSPIQCVRLHYRVPKYLCPECKTDTVTSHYAYPQIDPALVLSKKELQYIDGKRPDIISSEILIYCVTRIKEHWNVPISSGTSFGPIRIKVVTKAKMDFNVLPFHAGLFMRRRVVQCLQAEGYNIDYVESDAIGIYSIEADYVQIVTPVIAHETKPTGTILCPACLRINPDPGGINVQLINSSEIHNKHIFLTYERGIMVFSSDFVKTSQRLGFTGFVENKTIFPITVDNQ